MTIGPRFLEELEAAGLVGLPFSWGDDGDVQGWDNLTAEQSVLLKGVVDAHDPTLAASDEYKRLRAAEYPSIVDQLDKIYHTGIDGWKADIQVIKDKYPKE